MNPTSDKVIERMSDEWLADTIEETEGFMRDLRYNLDDIARYYPSLHELYQECCDEMTRRESLKEESE